MKKTLIILFAIVAFVSSVALAGETPVVPEKFENAFKRNFPNVNVTNWENKDELSIATFTNNTIKHFAYFDVNANLIAVVRSVTFDYMPLRIINALKEKYDLPEKMNIQEVYLTEGHIFYVMDVFHNNKSKTVKVYLDGTTEIIK